jgi:hypothetical protein
MPYKMIKRQVGIADPLGVTTKSYEQDEVIDDKEEWQKKLGERMMESGYAMYIEPDVVVPMHKDYDSIPSDVEPKQIKKTYKKKK